MLSADEVRRLVEALTLWAKQTPDIPVLGFLQQEELMTPSEIVQAVSKQTEDGRAILGILEHGVRREGLDAVTERLQLSKPQLSTR